MGKRNLHAEESREVGTCDVTDLMSPVRWDLGGESDCQLSEMLIPCRRARREADLSV
jgi:hypothetical protein